MSSDAFITRLETPDCLTPIDLEELGTVDFAEYQIKEDTDLLWDGQPELMLVRNPLMKMVFEDGYKSPMFREQSINDNVASARVKLAHRIHAYAREQNLG